jgi:hypothetical protein
MGILFRPKVIGKGGFFKDHYENIRHAVIEMISERLNSIGTPNNGLKIMLSQ